MKLVKDRAFDCNDCNIGKGKHKFCSGKCNNTTEENGEVFKKIDDYDYDISNLARVRSLKGRGRILKPQQTGCRTKYGGVYLWKHGEGKRFNITDLLNQYFPETKL